MRSDAATPRTCRVALFRDGGRTFRTHAAAVAAHLRASGVTTIDCVDRGDLPESPMINQLVGVYDAIAHVGAGGGAARRLADRLGIPLIESFLRAPREVLDLLDLALPPEKRLLTT